ncbi:MAG: hypothetical protein J6B77_09150 [Clostridia bacterium]|nr:hypothetical protein [Clostridia bacterium]
MKNSMFRILAAVLVFVFLLSAVSCSDKLGELTPDEKGGYVNSKNGDVYYPAPACYEVVSYVSEEAVAINDGFNFYAVEGTTDNAWLYNPDFGMLLYKEGETLPAISDFLPSAMDICLEGDVVNQTIFEIPNSEKINAVLSAYENGETTSYPGKQANYKFYLKFYSAEYSFLVYNLMFVQYGEDLVASKKNESGEVVQVNYGKNFLYNRYEDRFVAIGDEMQEYIDEYYRSPDAE